MKPLVLRILRQMKNDKRTLALLFVAPIVVLTLVYFLLGPSDYKPVVALNNVSFEMASALKNNEDILVTDLDKNSTPENFLKEKVGDGVITQSEKGLDLFFYENDSTIIGKVTEAVTDSLKGVNEENQAEMKGIIDRMTTSFDALATLPPTLVGSLEFPKTSELEASLNALESYSQVTTTFLYGSSEDTLFESLAYVFLGFISFFFIFLLAGVSFVRERTLGTIERLLMTPIRRVSVIGGYTLGYGFFAMLQSIFIILILIYLFKVPYLGSVFLGILMMVLLALTAVCLGVFISIFSTNEFQIMQFIPIIIIPQVFFTGLIPLETIPFGLSNLAYIMPLYYGCSGLKDLMVKGLGIEAIYPYYLILMLFILVLSVINVILLKKYRRT